MSLFDRMAQALRGARKLELFLLAALIATGGLMLFKGYDGNTDNDPEARLQEILGSISGVGKIKVAVNEDDSGNVVGVVVVAQGASDMRTYLAVQSAVHTFTGADISDIEIIDMEAGK